MWICEYIDEVDNNVDNKQQWLNCINDLLMSMDVMPMDVWIWIDRGWIQFVNNVAIYGT